MEETGGGGRAVPPAHHNKAHLAHGLLCHCPPGRPGVAQVHGDALDRLVLPRGVEDAEQELVDVKRYWNSSSSGMLKLQSVRQQFR